MKNFEKVINGGVCTPIGFSAGAISADIKGNNSEKKDFAALISDSPCVVAAIFTNNIVSAAPVKYSRQIIHKESEIWGVVVNSGNANACTGEKGDSDVYQIASSLEKELDLPEKSLLAASTGVIGKTMPTDKILNGIERLADELDDDGGEDFAKAIMTTDTFDKQIALLVNTSTGCYSIGSACKGAGMIDPNMATFLGFITTDAKIDKNILRLMLKEAVDQTFNCITIDGDMSTNDSLFLFSNGMSDVSVSTEEDIKIFKSALTFLCKELALMVVKDGEGATKCITIKVTNARTEKDAKLCAGKIANSPLVKTMFAGCDPNWGRLMSSAGASGAKFNPINVSIYFDDLHYVADGVIIDEKLESSVYSIMQKSEYQITIDLAEGEAESTCYTCDLTSEYVKINADYRS